MPVRPARLQGGRVGRAPVHSRSSFPRKLKKHSGGCGRNRSDFSILADNDGTISSGATIYPTPYLLATVTQSGWCGVPGTGEIVKS